MKKILSILAAVVGSATAGYAADMPAKAPAAFNWGGCYLGVEGGGSWGRSEQVAASGANAGATITGGFDLSGGLAGVTGGCNLQVSNFVVGMEDDFSWANGHGSAGERLPFNASNTNETSERWLNTLRGRVGYAFDRFMVYGTAGGALARTEVRVSGPRFGSLFDQQGRSGWVAGVGGEWAAWSLSWTDVILKVEYLHTDFGSALYFNPSGTLVTRSTRLSDDIVRAGVNLKFNWAGSAVAVKQ